MLYFTPKKDLSLLRAYHNSMEEMFAKADALVAKVRRDRYARFVMDPALELIRLDLERRKSWVNEAAHRYGCKPPWNDSLIWLEHLDGRWMTDDALAARQYRGKINYLLGRVEHTKEKDLSKLCNPFEWPSLIGLWFFVPVIKGVSPKLGEGTKNAFEGFSKQIGTFMAIALVCLLFWPWSGHSLVSLLKSYLVQQLGIK